MRNLVFVKIAVLVLGGVLLLSSCKKSSHDHIDAFGMVIFDNNVQVAIQQGGTVSYTNGSHILLEEGQVTSPMTVRFIDQNGDFIVIEDDDYFLRIQNSNPVAVNAPLIEGEIWQFRLAGLNEGESQLRFELMHVNHADFRSLPFIVVVQ
jgi:hypothetical protein